MAAPAKVEGMVFNDAVDNGIDAGDAAVSGVAVALYDDNNDLINTTTTDSNGNYEFDNLTDGVNYYVTFTMSGNGVFSPSNQDAPDDSSDVTTDNSVPGTISGKTSAFWVNGEVDDVDAGIFFGTNDATVSGTVFNDANGDGYNNDDDGGVSGVGVSLYDGNDNLIASTTTDSNGDYSFTGLSAGQYQVAISYGNSWILSPSTSVNVFVPGSLGTQSSVFSVGFDDSLTLNAGLCTTDATVNGNIFDDANDDGYNNDGDGGVSGVTVSFGIIYNETFIASTTTDSNGNYSFTGLNGGLYLITLGYSNSWAVSPSTSDNAFAPGDLGTQTSVFSVGSTGATENGGLAPGASPPVTINGNIFDDANDDGYNNDDDGGVSDVGVSLYDDNQNLITSTTTDNNGNYTFTGLSTGTYQLVITYDNSSWLLSPSTSDNAFSSGSLGAQTSVFSVGSTGATENGGLAPNSSVVNGNIFNDANDDGYNNDNDGGVSDIGVSLYDNNQNLIDSTITDDNGNYSFSGVAPGEYRVVITYDTNDWAVSPSTSDNAFSSGSLGDQTSVFSVAYNSTATENGGLAPTSNSVVSGNIFDDANDDGYNNDDDGGVSGVGVSLYDNNQNLIAYTITDNNGNYSFTGLAAGQYQVVITYDSSSWSLSPSTSDNAFSSGSLGTQTSVFSVAYNSTATENGGLAPTNGSSGPANTIIGNIFNDANDDGYNNDDAGGVSGISLTLEDSNGNGISTTTTDANGNYSFTGLAAGQYQIEISFTDDWVLSSKTSDNAFSVYFGSDAGTTGVFSLSQNGTAVENGGLAPVTSLNGVVSGTIWNDANDDGYNNDGQGGVASVNVYLYDNNDNLIAVTTTDSNGNYSFTGLATGQYQVVISYPSPWVLSPYTGDNDFWAGSLGSQTDVFSLSATGSMTENGGLFVSVR